MENNFNQKILYGSSSINPLYVYYSLDIIEIEFIRKDFGYLD